MILIENELQVGFDIDGTLIRPAEGGSIKLPYGSSIKSFEPIMEHIELLKEYKNRGFHVTVWSMGGPKWVKLVVEALKIERFVDEGRGKMLKHVDDRTDVESIVGSRVFLI